MAVTVQPRVLRNSTTSTEQRTLIEVAEALEHTKYMPLRRVELRVHSQSVVLSGDVPSYFLKQLAQVAAMSVPSVRRLENQLRVTNRQSHRLDAEQEW